MVDLVCCFDMLLIVLDMMVLVGYLFVVLWYDSLTDWWLIGVFWCLGLFAWGWILR